MGWYCHPDTMAIADAQHAARKAVGADVGMSSLAYKKAYRDAYAADAQASGFATGLEEYLKELDDEITFFEQGGSESEYAAFMTQRNLSATVLFQLSHSNPSKPPSDRWAVIKRLLPNPDEVVLVREIYDAIDRIDRDVHWQVSEPQWWLEMSNYQRALGKRL